MTDPERLLQSSSPDVKALLASGWQPRALDSSTRQRVGRRLASLAAATPLTLLTTLMGGKAAATALAAAGTAAVAVGVWSYGLGPSSERSVPTVAGAAAANRASRTLPAASTLPSASAEEPAAPSDSASTAPTEVGPQPAPVAVPGGSVRAAPPAVDDQSLRNQPRQQTPTHPSQAVAPAASSSAASSIAAELASLEHARVLLAQSPAQALAIVESHRARFPDGQLGLESDVLTIRALVQLGRRAEARQLADRLGSQVRGSLYQERIRRALGEKD
jgi:hypothetical protein